MKSNPLLQGGATALTDFAAFEPAQVTPAISTLLAQAEAALEAAAGPDVPADYEAMSTVLDVATESLQRGWGVVQHLNSVADTPDLRAAYNDNLAKVTEFYTRLGGDQRLYAKYKAIDASAAARTLSAPRRKLLEHALRDFVLAGAELQGDAKARYAQIQERHAALSQAFSEHVLDATDQYALHATAAQLEGVPQDVLDAIRIDAAQPRPEGVAADAHYKLTLKGPVYIPVMQYARDRGLREALYRAYTTRASEQGPDHLDNSQLMRELLELRAEEAHLLGHGSYADVSLVPKMAPSPQKALAFMRDLAKRAKPFAESDLQEVRAFAAKELGLHDVQAWDIAYVSEKLKEAHYAFSEQEVKQYFTEPAVLAGLFRIVEQVFEVKILPDHAPTWHADVRFFRVERDGALLAQFYLDPYARDGKRPGAWMDDARMRWRRPDGNLQTPVAHLVCNFAATGGWQAGTADARRRHHPLPRVWSWPAPDALAGQTTLAFQGSPAWSGTRWSCQASSWKTSAGNGRSLSKLSAHVDTGQPLPRALYDKMIAAKNFQSGMQTVRQIEFALFDMRIHHEAGAAARIQAVLDEVRDEVAVVKSPAREPLPAQLLAHLQRRLRSGLLQLQVGRGAQRRRLERF